VFLLVPSPAVHVRQGVDKLPDCEFNANFAACEASNQVRVVSKSAWREAIVQDHTIEGPIADWYKVAKCAEWKNLVDVRKVYPHADYVDPYTVFNIKGNTYRLIVKIEYRWQIIFVKNLLTHDEYDKGGWKR